MGSSKRMSPFDKPGPNPIKLFSASIYATLKRQPTREAERGRVITLIGQNFSVASIEAKKSFIGLGPGQHEFGP